MTTQTRPGEPIVLERSYKASIQDIWELWTTKTGFESWWGPQGFRAEVHEIDPRAGGTLRYDMIADTPEMVAEMKKLGSDPMHRVTARFSEIVPLKRLVIVSVIDFLPGVEPYDSTIAVDFRVEGDRVSMVTTLYPMMSLEMSQMQKEGYSSQLTKLDARFA